MTLLKMYFRAHTGSLISQPSNDHQQQQHRPEAAEVQKELGTGLFFITRLRAKITDYMCSKAKNIKDFKLWLALLQKKKEENKISLWHHDQSWASKCHNSAKPYVQNYCHQCMWRSSGLCYMHSHTVTFPLGKSSGYTESQNG